MPVTIQILREGRVIQCTYADSFTLNEMSQTIKATQDIIQPATNIIYTIYDFTAVKHLSANILSITMKTMPKPHPMAGLSILVTSNAFINVLIDILSKMIPPDKMLSRRTVAEA